VDVNGNLIKFKDESEGISFWVFSPRSLVDLLAEPDLPKLSMNALNVKDFNLELNGKNIALNNIPLERGWNKFVIKFTQNVTENKQNIKVILITDRNEFFKQIDSITER
jgi:beta-galactosidase